MHCPHAIALRIGLAALASLFLIETPIDARTWRVTPDGTGDAPDLMAVMDSVSAHDTVLVAPGEHVISRVFAGDAIWVIGEEGPLQTRLVPIGQPEVSGVWLDGALEISGLWFDGFYNTYGNGAVNIWNSAGRVVGCVFTNNEIGISLFSASADIEGNTFLGNFWAFYGYGGGRCVYNIIWDPAQDLGGFSAICNDVLRLEDIRDFWRPANFSLDPQFCGPDDFRIMTTSPCAPGNSPLGENCPSLIGALPAYCSPSLIEQRTWGQIKALYKR
jgi:parallel beta-helix repeat protein